MLTWTIIKLRMTAPLPKFDAPPVIETVLSAQFARLEQFSNAHAGWFWKNYLGAEWSHVQSAPRLDDQFERFGDEVRWGLPLGIRVVPGMESERLQILRDDDESMMQVQDSRLIYNWRKQKHDYPSYDKVLHEFKNAYSNFEKFVKDARLGSLELNQWEVTYVNHIAKGELWNNFSDWAKIFPRLPVLVEGVPNLGAEDFRGTWRLAFGDKQGRLHVTLNHGRTGSEKGTEVIRLELTARGPVDLAKGFDLWNGFAIAHSTIVNYFAAMTSSTAHRYWKRRV